jgi:hypothetical protein
MTHSEQKRVQALREKVAEAYKAHDTAPPEQREALGKKWLAANERLDTYLDGVYAREEKRARR